MNLVERLRRLAPDAPDPVAPLDDALVRALLAGAPRRVAHILGVTDAARALGPWLGGGPALAARLALAALCHDLGYAPALRVTGFHPLDGAIFLARRAADPDVVAAVLFHDEACATAADHPAAAPFYAALGPPAPTPLLDAVTTCDRRTAPDGAPVTLAERAAEIVARHGPDAPAARRAVARQPALRAARDRTLRRLAANAPGRLPWVFVDLDATLAPPARPVSPGTRAALAAYAAAGGRVSLATGRHPGAIAALGADLGLPGPHIAGNGTVAIAAGGPRLVARMGVSAAPSAARLRALGVPFVTFALEGLYVESPDVTAEHLSALDAYDEPPPVPGAPPDPDTVFKLLMFVDIADAAREALLRERARELGVDCVRTSSLFLELVPPGSSKGAAMAGILHDAGWPAWHSVAAGDSENDLSLLRRAGRALAVANATPAVLAAADEVLPSCAEDGVAAALRALLGEAGATART